MVESVRTGEPKGYEHATSARRPPSEAEIRCEQLMEALKKAQDENANLRARIAELEGQLGLPPSAAAAGENKTRQSLNEAKLIDSLVNGPTQ